MSTTPVLTALRSTIGLAPIAWTTPATDAGCSVYRGFTADLDGFADDLIWSSSLGEIARGWDALEREATYRWAVRRGLEIVDYCEGDISVIVCPDGGAADREWARVISCMNDNSAVAS